MATLKEDQPRGVLLPTQPQTHARYLPAEPLRDFVEHYWSVEWDFRGRPPHVARTLPHPSVHLTFEDGASQVIGVVTGAFSKSLDGKGRVLGVKFRPGGFHPFLQRDVAELTDDTRSGESVFGEAITALTAELERFEDDSSRVDRVEAFLLDRLPDSDANIEVVQGVVDRILREREITKVDDVVRLCGISKRTLQRLFSRYVGVSPKWVIQRYRLHEAAEQIASGAVTDWAQLAVSLGYFDQAHFIKDFRAIVGQTPAEYAASRKA